MRREKLLRETFNPITQSLEGFAKAAKRPAENNGIKGEVKEERPGLKRMKNEYSYNEDIDDNKDMLQCETSQQDSDEDQFQTFDAASQETISSAQSAPSHHSLSECFESQDLGKLSKQYFDLYNSEEQIDKTYGVRLNPLTKEWMLGNTAVKFEGNNIKIGDKVYEGTEGLHELLFLKQPNEDVITDRDLDVYMDILNLTNVHRRNYDKHSQIKGGNSKKYKFISKLLKEKKGGSLMKLASYKHDCDGSNDSNLAGTLGNTKIYHAKLPELGDATPLGGVTPKSTPEPS